MPRGFLDVIFFFLKVDWNVQYETIGNKRLGPFRLGVEFTKKKTVSLTNYVGNRKEIEFQNFFKVIISTFCM